ncbi:MAG TPA: hypothetical protein EYP58_06080, partial [bacterium (Candidatus Stahlbacteria)]|nr:hypothetical protein [Candidatus Stahlbacteria bacterium]
MYYNVSAMVNIPPQQRLKIVKQYLNRGLSLREAARHLNINYVTLFKWVKLYREKGELGILNTYRRPWNRASIDLESKVVQLKEHCPALTVRSAKKILEHEGMRISIKGIWGIWKRYGYCGFRKRSIHIDFTDYIPWSKEAKDAFETVKAIFDSKSPKIAARILNSVPALPNNDIIAKIPDRLLNSKRRVEKIPRLFGQIALPSFLRKARRIYKLLCSEDLNYSALRVGLTIIVGLEWKVDPGEHLRMIRKLKDIITKNSSPRGSYLLSIPKFIILSSECMAYARLQRMRKADITIKNCKKMLIKRKDLSPHILVDMGITYSNLQDFRLAERFLLMAMDRVDETTKKRIRCELANIYLGKGNLRMAKRILKEGGFYAWGKSSFIKLFYAKLSLMEGCPQKTLSFTTDSLSLSREESLNQCIFSALFTASSAWSALGYFEKSNEILKNISLFLRNKNLREHKNIVEIILAP